MGSLADIQQTIDAAMEQLVGAVWGLWLVCLLVGAGIIFTLANGGVQLRGFWHAINVVRGKFDRPEDEGQLTHFQALTAALSATIGLGNIAGVAVAVATGGAGAVFWMWVAGFFGMATKFVSCTLAILYRDVREDGTIGGGPMYYMEMGMGRGWRPLAGLFAVFVTLGSFGGGNMFQSNQAAAVMSKIYGVPVWVTGLFLVVGVGMVIIGGIRRIGQVTSKIVPVMCLLYIGGALVTLFINASEIPGVFRDIFSEALTLKAGIGGFLGTMLIGVKRAAFSNEAGLGSAAIAHSTARTDEPVREGLVAMLGPFIDTIVVCTTTALVILVSGITGEQSEGVNLTVAAFNQGIPGFGSLVVASAVVLFAFSTAISWSYYGEKGIEYLFGSRMVMPYKVVYVGLIFVGAMWKLGPVLDFSDATIGLMAVPNLIALLFLFPRVRRATKEYMDRLRAGEMKQYR